MHIVFVCPGMPFSGDFVQKNKSLGGSESACYYLAREMAQLGHKVLVMTSEEGEGGKYDGVDYSWCGPQSERWPCGEYAHTTMETMPTDVLIVQRSSGIHRAPHAAKVAFWWLHDLALVRQMPGARADAHLYDGTLAVSNWHRKQILDTWETNPDYVHVLPNSVDGSLYRIEPVKREDNELRLLYQSRFERGIDILVAPGGVMDQLASCRPEARLFVCGYANYPQHMQFYYENVMTRIKQMPNVELLGHLSKAQLAQLQTCCDAMLYPGDFEETSCISAMEAQAAGLPFVGAARGALPETCGAHSFELGDDGAEIGVSGPGSILFEGDIVQRTKNMTEFLATVSRETLSKMSEGQRELGKKLDWAHSAAILSDLIDKTFERKQRNSFSMIRSMIDRSDVVLARKFISLLKADGEADVLIEEREELLDAYTFTQSMQAHYDSDEAVADIARNENLDVRGMLRFRQSEQDLMQDNPANVLDYGCQKGHYIWSLAQRRPDVRYTGVDVSPRVVQWALEHCKVQGAQINFRAGDALSDEWDPKRFGKFDALLLGEVLEHVENPALLMDKLDQVLTDGARVVITTPFGDWEGKDYNARPGMPRYHLHHFERVDLTEMFGHNEGFFCTCVPAGRSERETLGSYVVTFKRRAGVSMTRDVDWARKLRLYSPRETLSFTALARNSEVTVLRSLMTVREVADEFVIALDKTTTDKTRRVLEEFRDQYAGYRRFVILDAESPLEVGFDEARNRTVDAARGDWILWLDNDEDLVYPERMLKYLRHNQFDGYAVAQHHWSADPVGVLSTDWPVRIFRKADYLRFVGVVHEHPDDIERGNKGPRAPAQLGDFHIVHHGYSTEPVRRARFERNFPLIRRDRKQHPDRLLGTLLWVRDLAHMCMFELERTRGQLTPQCLDYAREGLVEWDKLLERRKEPIVSRMIRDGVDFYSTLVNVTGQGFQFDIQLHASKGTPADMARGPRRKGTFLNREHLDKYLECCVDEQTAKFDSRYF